MNLAFLANLYGGAESYNTCKSEKVGDVMREFKDKDLKDRSGKIITNQKQAIAIALSQAQKTCKYSSSDVKKLVEKVNEDLNDKTKKINLTNVIETKDAIKELHKINKHKKAYVFSKLLWNKIIESQLSNEKLDKNIWEEIKKIHEN